LQHRVRCETKKQEKRKKKKKKGNGREVLLKICSFNVNSIRVRKDLILEWLKHRNEDVEILCFQELKAIDSLFPYEDFEKLGFQCEVFGQKAYNGVAICSKYPLENIQKGFGDATWDEQKRFIAANIHGIRFINIYAPHGDLQGKEKFDYKQGWYKELITVLDHNFSPNDSIIIIGDFNVAREDRDVYDADALKDSIGTLPEERQSLEELLQWGLIDVFRHKYPDKTQFTWWDYIGGAIWRDQGMRIDYILCTESLIHTVETVEVDLWPRRRREPKPSDHAPLIATLSLP
jgi:exodeoxyribonuclease-3